MSEPMRLLEGLSQPFPDHAIEQRAGAGGRMLDYVATETVIRRLNRIAPNWSFTITDKVWREFSTNDRDGNARHLTNLIVFGEMTIPGLGTRAGMGVQIIEDGRGGEDMVKGAASDCLKKCATLFGVGIDLYGPDLEAGEMPRQRQQAPVNRQNGAGATQRPAQGSEFPAHAQSISRPGEPATERQVGAIRDITQRKGITEDGLIELLMTEFGHGIDVLTKAEASKVIEKYGSPRPQAVAS